MKAVDYYSKILLKPFNNKKEPIQPKPVGSSQLLINYQLILIVFSVLHTLTFSQTLENVEINLL